MDKNSKVSLNSGNKIPVLGLGTWRLNVDTAGTIVKALQLGYPMIDTSGDYGTQPGIGEGIKKSHISRNQIYLVTKVEETDDAYKATRKNLGELQLEYADMMLIHRPPKKGAGEELWQGLIRAKKEGLVRDIGVSNYSKEQIETLIDTSGVTPTLNQIEWSPFGYSNVMRDYCQKHQIIIQAYSPLTRTKRLQDPNLLELGRKYSKSPAQILIRWNLQTGTVPIPKANQISHLEEDIDVFDLEISDEDIFKLNNLNEEYSTFGKLPYL